VEDILAFLGSNVFNSLIPIGNAQISNPQLKIISFPNYKLQTAPSLSISASGRGYSPPPHSIFLIEIWKNQTVFRVQCLKVSGIRNTRKQ